jgi:hypothetical protein
MVVAGSLIAWVIAAVNMFWPLVAFALLMSEKPVTTGAPVTLVPVSPRFPLMVVAPVLVIVEAAKTA